MPSKDYQASFEHTLKDGRTVTVLCSNWHEAEWDVGLGAGYENVWAVDENGHEIELTDDQVQELYDATIDIGYPDPD